MKNSKLPETILISYNGEIFINKGKTNIKRPDNAKRFGNTALYGWLDNMTIKDNHHIKFHGWSLMAGILGFRMIF